MKKTKVLFVGAHHEEIEAECPNLAASLAMAGCDVTVLNPVGGWNWTYIRSLGEGARERILTNSEAAAKELGVRKIVWDYPVSRLEKHKAELMEQMADFVLELNPEIVFMHWPEDCHADHRFIAKLTVHVLRTAPGISEKPYPDYRMAKEIYAFQTGVGQAYGFVPDLLVKTTSETMERSDRAIDCFASTHKDTEFWKASFHAKAAYWANHTPEHTPAEALKFLGPQLPLDGFLLKKLLGDLVVAAPFDRLIYNSAFQW